MSPRFFSNELFFVDSSVPKNYYFFYTEVVFRLEDSSVPEVSFLRVELVFRLEDSRVPGNNTYISDQYHLSIYSYTLPLFPYMWWAGRFMLTLISPDGYYYYKLNAWIYSIRSALKPAQRTRFKCHIMDSLMGQILYCMPHEHILYIYPAIVSIKILGNSLRETSSGPHFFSLFCSYRISSLCYLPI